MVIKVCYIDCLFLDKYVFGNILDFYISKFKFCSFGVYLFLVNFDDFLGDIGVMLK